MLAFVRLHARKLIWLLLMLVLFWRWGPAAHPLAAAAPVALQGAKVELGAREILDRMVAAYASAKSYRDVGVVQTTWSGWRSHVNQRPFETAFVRGGGFRFEYADQGRRSILDMLMFHDERMVIWGDNQNAKTWWTVHDGQVEEGTLGLAIAGATGVSGGASHSVPRMLLPDAVEGACIDDIEAAMVAGIESVGGHPCFKLAGTRGDETVEMWIDRETFLIRRIREVDEIGGKQVEEITAYDPKLNVDLAADVFRFEPPK